MQLLVKNVLQSIAPYVGASGTCADDTVKITEYIDYISQMLWVRGDWKGTVEFGCIRAENGCFALPWNLDEVRNAWYCNQPMLVRDEYYQGFPEVGMQNRCGGCCYPQIIQTGRSLPYQHKPPKGWRLAVVGSTQETEALTFYVTDHAGQRQQESVIPSLDVQRLSTTLGNVITVEKPRTKGFVRVMAWHPDHPDMEFVARYDAHQENPEFTEYKITGQVDPCVEIILRCKKKYVPIRELSDPIWINSDVALEFGAMAYNAKLQRNIPEYVANLNMAEEHLEEVLENQKPKAWSPLNVRYQRQAMSPQATSRLGYANPRWRGGVL